MVNALLNEISLRQNYLEKTDPVETIYFGGGTPSLLKASEIKRLLKSITATFRVAAQVEVTLEANPDDIEPGKLEAWKQAGINRLSMGVQSFLQADLAWMNRAHNAAQSLQSIESIYHAGIRNISIDLIYGLPGMTDTDWEFNIDKAISLQIPHLSCYALTVEPKTALHAFIAKHKVPAPDPNIQARHFEILVARLRAAGYEHYEISNFAKPGYRSRHNTAYWQGKHYLGIGPSAHSYNGFSRQWNVANNSRYIQSIRDNQPDYEKEILTPTQQVNEYIMTSIRTMEGTNLDYLEKKWGNAVSTTFIRKAGKHIKNGNGVWTNDHFQLTGSGKFLADGIAADLFMD